MTTIDISDKQAAIFDMDGTMIDNMTFHKKAWQTYLEQHGLSLTEQEFHEKVSGKKNDEIFEIVLGSRPDDSTLERMSEEKESVYRELYKDEIREIEGLTNVIAGLEARGLRLAIATTAPRSNRDFALHALQLSGRFEVILGDEDVSQGKPHPEIYLETAKQLGIETGACIAFEDSPSGVQSAKAAGMTVVAILSSHSKDELPEADYWINDYHELVLQ